MKSSKYNINVISSTGGTTSITNAFFKIDETITLIALANEGYIFSEWETDDITLNNTNNEIIIFAMPNHHLEIKANFIPINIK